MKYVRRTAGYTWTDYKTNAQIAKELKITQILDKLLERKRSWVQHVNRMPRNRLPRVMKYYSPTGRRNHGRTLTILLDTWDRNGSTSGPTPWKICDDNDKAELLLLEVSNLHFILPNVIMPVYPPSIFLIWFRTRIIGITLVLLLPLLLKTVISPLLKIKFEATRTLSNTVQMTRK